MAFEAHLSATTLHLKDDLRLHYATSRTSFTCASEFSSFLLADSAIKYTSMILDKEIDAVLHFDYKDLESHSTTMGNKNWLKVCETESNDDDSEPSWDFTSGTDVLDYL